MTKELRSDIDTYWQQERVTLCALLSLHGVSFKTLHALALTHPSLKNFLRQSTPTDFSKHLRVTVDKQHCDTPLAFEQFKLSLWANGIACLKRLAVDNIQLIFLQQPAFPARLKSIDNPPLWLFVQGNVDNLHRPAITLIGSRKCSDDGYWLSRYILTALHGRDVVTVSGLAEGIDQSVHYGSLRFNLPTIAVLGTGIDSTYPKGAESLRTEILLRGGTIITEYLPGQSYSASQFVQRNRIQAALGHCVIPIEWAVRSGTAHTVSFSKAYQKPIAMLHLPDSASSPECHFIADYTHGSVFNVPAQHAEFNQYLSDRFNAVQTLPEAPTDTTQNTLDL